MSEDNVGEKLEKNIHMHEEVVDSRKVISLCRLISLK